MKVLLDIDDDQGYHLLEVLKSLPYVKAQELTDEKAALLTEIWEATEEMKSIKEGKKSGRDAEEFLDEL